MRYSMTDTEDDRATNTPKTRESPMPSQDLPSARGTLYSKPFSYADLISYQEGAVVSRTVIDKKPGTVTVFAFDKGERLSEHTAPFDALIEVIDGTGVVTIEGTPHEVLKGQSIIMPANRPHAVDAVERFKMVLVMIRA
jgi:quercetin dioxygenase-like cupin family protein